MYSSAIHMYVRQTTASYLSYAPTTAAYLPTSLQDFFKITPSLELELEAEAAGGQVGHIHSLSWSLLVGLTCHPVMSS